MSFVVIDGSTVQEPGATETTYRLHIAIDLISLTLRQVEVSTDKIGESLDHYALESGDIVLIDRGYNQPGHWCLSSTEAVILYCAITPTA